MSHTLKFTVLLSTLLWPFLVGAVVACVHELPTSRPENPFSPRTIPTTTGWARTAQRFLPTRPCFSWRFTRPSFIIGRVPVPWVRVYFFGLLVAASLPYIWVLLSVDWRNPHVFPVSCWVHDPIGFWIVPSISFAADTRAMRSPGLLWYVGRSCLELVLIAPCWVCWAIVSFMCLGGGWI